jgi:hypothetical protein
MSRSRGAPADPVNALRLATVWRVAVKAGAEHATAAATMVTGFAGNVGTGRRAKFALVDSSEGAGAGCDSG